MGFTEIFVFCFLFALGFFAFFDSRKSNREIKKLINQKDSGVIVPAKMDDE